MKHPFRGVPVTDDMCSWLGKIAIVWGALELRLNETIEALGKPTVLPEGWRKRSFKSRKVLCKELIKERFPAVLPAFTLVLGAASEAHWKRNTLLHGELASTLEVVQHGDHIARIPPVVDARITARGAHNGRPVTLILWTREVEDIFYEVGHALGLLCQLTDPTHDFPELPLPDKRAWLDFLAKDLPPLPN